MKLQRRSLFVISLQSKKMEQWPESDLEWMDRCPICQSTTTEILYKGLPDCVFFCAPGKWTIYQCIDCGSGYLNPRPTPESIGLAYGTYYTHEESQIRGRAFIFLRSMVNGYLNTRYETDYDDAFHLGNVLTRILLPLRRKADHIVRHLKPENHGDRLLDIGCGNGSYLREAKRMGWDPTGLDPDPASLGVSGADGYQVVKGILPGIRFQTNQFDAITMSHSIEHMHFPLEALREVHRILRPGGRLWIATPNFSSIGHRRFRENWVALDPPRHLMLFTQNSLRGLLERSGFKNIQILPSAPTAARVFAASRAISIGVRPFSEKKNLLKFLNPEALLADFRSVLAPELSEEIVFLAVK